MDLAELIVSSRPYLARFDRGSYPLCFQKFEAACAPIFDALTDTEPEQAAYALVDALAQRRAALSRRDRRRALDEDRRMLALFLSPAAARRPDAAAFAAALNRVWNARYPRTPFLTGSYEDIMRGFEPRIMGIPLR